MSEPRASSRVDRAGWGCELLPGYDTPFEARGASSFRAVSRPDIPAALKRRPKASRSILHTSLQRCRSATSSSRPRVRALQRAPGGGWCRRRRDAAWPDVHSSLPTLALGESPPSSSSTSSVPSYPETSTRPPISSPSEPPPPSTVAPPIDAPPFLLVGPVFIPIGPVAAAPPTAVVVIRVVPVSSCLRYRPGSAGAGTYA
mmetsp:Transcript_9550/g.17988  ORF Transcript_9550/g.17988 Transcript_9550/m.17988 type:complete len:201 (-) Transcript_9550:1044-1646(-)